MLTPLSVTHCRTTRAVVVQCPHCGRKHSHGWSYASEAVPGHRLAHCGHGGYYIAAPGAELVRSMRSGVMT